MDKKSKELALLFLFLIAISLLTIFYRYIILGDVVFFTDEEAFQTALLEEE